MLVKKVKWAASVYILALKRGAEKILKAQLGEEIGLRWMRGTATT